MHLVVVELEIYPAREHADGIKHGAVRALHTDVFFTACDFLVGDKGLPGRAETGTFYVFYEPFEKFTGYVTASEMAKLCMRMFYV